MLVRVSSSQNNTLDVYANKHASIPWQFIFHTRVAFSNNNKCMRCYAENHLPLLREKKYLNYMKNSLRSYIFKYLKAYKFLSTKNSYNNANVLLKKCGILIPRDLKTSKTNIIGGS